MKSLQMEGTIEINDSLPFGGDNMDTLNLPEQELQSMADRFTEATPEPNLEAATTDPVAICSIWQV